METTVALKDFKQAFDQYCSTVEKVSIDELSSFSCDDFYDGMLSGLVTFNGQTHRFEIITDWKNGIRPRVFAVISLTKIQIEKEVYWQNLFKSHVYDGVAGCSKPKSEHHLFYDAYQKRADPNYGNSPVIAWYAEE